MRLGLVALAIFGFAGLVASPAQAGQIGTISVCYACDGTGTYSTGDSAIDAALAANPSVAYDGILFAFTNTSGFDITNAVISVGGTSPADSFSLGTVAAGSEVILLPGISNDGGTHPSNGLFFNTGTAMDTSDGAGDVNDSSIFSFTGTSDSLAVISLTAGTGPADGTFTPGDPGLIQNWISPTTGMTSFVGDGPSGDGGCSDCYFGVVATLNVPDVGTPEPQSFSLMLGGFGVIGWALRRRLVRS